MPLTDSQLQFSKTISLAERDNRFQLIYATHLYGTLFGVFARFQTEKIDDDSIKVKMIDFMGINYKGNINLGIKGIKVNEVVDDVLKIDLILQADGTGFRTKEFLKPDLPEVMQEDEPRPHFDNIIIKKDQSLEVIRTLVPMNIDHPDYENLQDEIRAFKDGKFDSEFFIRDGLFVKKKDIDPNKVFEQHRPASVPTTSPLGVQENVPTLGVSCRIGKARFFLS